jgi:NAD-dependent dihydropyrimidine dehydrogenase PreA subunit
VDVFLMKTKLILIEGKQIGIVGLEEVFEELKRTGSKPDEPAKALLLDKLKVFNYVPANKEKEYASAFLDEYHKYCHRGGTKTQTKKKDLGTWQGVPREEIPWYPTIREELCNGCNACLEFCSYGVFEYEETTSKVSVMHPFNCIVGCSICALKCDPKAIVFPPLSILETFRKR